MVFSKKSQNCFPSKTSPYWRLTDQQRSNWKSDLKQTSYSFSAYQVKSEKIFYSKKKIKIFLTFFFPWPPLFDPKINIQVPKSWLPHLLFDAFSESIRVFVLAIKMAERIIHRQTHRQTNSCQLFFLINLTVIYAVVIQQQLGWFFNWQWFCFGRRSFTFWWIGIDWFYDRGRSEWFA